MPLNTISTYVLSLLDGLPLPGPAGESGSLACYITPPDPGDLMTPVCYLWPVTGDEARIAMPRAQAGSDITQAGWKRIIHKIELWITWLGAGEDPTSDVNFPAVVDAIMAALRPSPDPVPVTDPVTGVISSTVVGVAEEMTYEYSVVHALEDQRYLRYDARLTVTAWEVFQS